MGGGTGTAAIFWPDLGRFMLDGPRGYLYLASHAWAICREVVNRLRSKVGVPNRLRSKAGVTNRLHSKAGVTNRLRSKAGVTNRLRSKAGVTNRLRSKAGVPNRLHSKAGVKWNRTGGKMTRVHHRRSRIGSIPRSHLVPLRIVLSEPSARSLLTHFSNLLGLVAKGTRKPWMNSLRDVGETMRKQKVV
jgi:hypothetical protein